MNYCNKTFFLTNFVIVFFLLGGPSASEFLCATHKIQTPGGHPKERMRNSERDEI